MQMETLEQRGRGSIASVNPLVDKHKQLVNATGVDDVNLADTWNSFLPQSDFFIMFPHGGIVKICINVLVNLVKFFFSKQLPSVWKI